MYDMDTATKSLSKRKQEADKKAVKAICEGRYEDAARYVAEAAGYMGAMDELAFMAECGEVE